MQLPDYIYNFFVKINTGILSPVLSGISYLLPMIMLLALVCSIIWVIFSNRKSVAIGFMLVLLVANFALNTLPQAIQLISDWFGSNSTVDLSSAQDSFNKGLQDGNSAVQGH